MDSIENRRDSVLRERISWPVDSDPRLSNQMQQKNADARQVFQVLINWVNLHDEITFTLIHRQ